MDVLISLDAPAARDGGVVGAKAARLAAARVAGLPVPPGWVVPASASARAVSVGAEALRTAGHAAARLAVASIAVDDALVDAVEDVTRSLGGRVVVRSSFVDEADPRWSGAFASYLDVGPDEVLTALRGCWASVFSRDVEARCAYVGVGPPDLRMAVLVQPHLDLRSGGLARVAKEGRVMVSTVPASPAGLMAGRRTGVVAQVESDAVAPGGGIDHAGPVARLAAIVHDVTRDDTIEWGTTTSGAVVLLQASTTPAFDRPRPVPRFVDVPRSAVGIAVTAARFPGPIGEELVLTWAAGLDAAPDPAPVDVPDLSRAFAHARSVSVRLAADAWGLPASDAVPAAREAFASVHRDDPVARADALERIGALRPVDRDAGASVVATIRGIAQQLERTDVVASAALVWHATPEELERAVAFGQRPSVVTGPDRWESLLVDVVGAHGITLAGDAVVPGAGAGIVRRIGPRWYAEAPGRRQVLVAPYPWPHLAPLLWQSAGLVTTHGSAGAHLFEVARALGVPAVSGIELPPEARRDGAVVAVDGDTGTVGVLTMSSTSRPRDRDRMHERVGGRS